MPPYNKAIYFGSFLVDAQVFLVTKHSFALVNLKPLLPGHVLVSPLRKVARLHDLTTDEVSDLFVTTQRVGRMIERVFKASALNVAVQDGEAAGQSVPHVHAHVIPRHGGDLDHRGGSDAIYDMLQGEEGDIGKHQSQALSEREAIADSGQRRKNDFPAVDNDSRKPRSHEEMKAEAEWFAKEMESDTG